MLFKLALKNIISRKSSFAIIGFIAFSVSLFVLSNSIFDSTERGVENLFISGFTGDFAIRPLSERPCSLFGDETPIVGELTVLSRLVPFAEISDYLQESPYVEGGLPMTWSNPNGARAFTWLYQEVTSVVDEDRNENPSYSAEATETKKREYIQKIFEESVSAYKNSVAHDTWFMNDLGGYYCYQTERTGIFGVHLGWDDHIDTQTLAADMLHGTLVLLVD